MRVQGPKSDTSPRAFSQGFVDALKHDISSYLATGEDRSAYVIPITPLYKGTPESSPHSCQEAPPGFPAPSGLKLADCLLEGRVLCLLAEGEVAFAVHSEGEQGAFKALESYRFRFHE